MNKPSFVAILAIAAAVTAGPVFATQGFTPANNESGGRSHAMPGIKTRDQVKQEAIEALRQGEIQRGEVTYAPEVEDATSTRSRAEVAHEGEHVRDDKALRELYRN